MTIPTTPLPGGFHMPVLGQGTWGIGVNRSNRRAEVRALQLGMDLGMTLIDTAEMYGDAESVVGEAIRGRRDEVFVVTKVLPSHASRRGTIRACERSLRKLAVDCIDLYLLHWSGSEPLGDTFAAFEELRQAGRIKSFGVSNFDLGELQAAQRIAGPGGIATNQILYNLARRGPEAALIPHCEDAGIVIMAYSPLEQAALDFTGTLAEVGRRHGATPAQVAIAWTLRRPGVAAIPKAAREAHVRENAGAAGVRLLAEDLADLERAFPSRTSSLEWL